jgi:hypothetical protein
VDESAHHALLANAGGREIVGKKEGEQKGSARGNVHWGCYYATALNIEVDPQRCCLGHRQSVFALQAVVECSASLNQSASVLMCCDDTMFRLFITERKGNIHWNVPSRVEASKAAMKQLPACHATRGKTEEPYDPQRTTT